ncbi:MAG: helicase-exonuclease AddAB subunit AddA [Roseburia sp.]
MTEKKWTPQQQQVIELRDKNILVSAAAGAGKTAVLVERIRQRVMDTQHPVDVDRLLVVTFTNAAAAQMKERVLNALEQQQIREPENSRLAKQAALVVNAQITTIDSFCLYVIRNHFHEIGLEPDFRIADEGELKLLEEDVLSLCMEQWYEENEPGFSELVEAYAPGRSDVPVREMILKLYRFSQSYPWPEQWMDETQKLCDCGKDEKMNETPWVRECVSYVREMLRGCAALARDYLAVCQQADGPDMYEKACQADVDLFQELADCPDYETLRLHLAQVKFQTLGRAKNYSGSPEKQEYVKAAREQCKKQLSKLREEYLSMELKDIAAQQQRIYPCIETLIRLTKDFSQRLSEKKRSRNVVDFNDIEHFALQILVDEKTGNATSTAKQLRKLYEEIMIDEYQDSNYVQETILRTISREEEGSYNLFMVGDVKQSIYRFRLARPELFMEKYDTYQTAEGDCRRVDLLDNFRSRGEVLDFANDVFSQIMSRDLGGVDYDEAARLHRGGEFPEAEAGMFDTELLVTDSAQGEELGVDAREQEAKMVAQKITDMMGSQLVTDTESGELRPVRYGDIVILLRSMSDWSDVFARVLNASGIPAHTVSKTGYFSAPEVQTVLNYLRILDNPRQDIPLTAILHGPMVELTDEELSYIRLLDDKKPFFACVMDAVKNQEIMEVLPEQVQRKLKHFWEVFSALRSQINELPIHELLQKLFSVTGYLDYAAAMPGGRQRQANLHMLLEKAIAYEKTSYRGLFHFIRYIDELQKYDLDFGEADLATEKDDTVSIMSIHKSKGLEFPVCFVCGMGKNYNMSDSRSKLLLHADLGIGLDEIDVKRRLKIPSFTKRVIGRRIALESLGEELRVLYVAFTRAKDKLIVTGCDKGIDEILEQCMMQNDRGMRIPFMQKVTARNQLTLVLQAVCNLGKRYPVQKIEVAQLVSTEVRDQIQTQEELKLRIRQALSISPEEISAWGERLTIRYAHEQEADLVTKYSVSELKHRAMRERIEKEDTDCTPYFLQEEVKTFVPAFMEGQEEVNQGALRGTAVHRVLECYDFAAMPEQPSELAADIDRQLTELIEIGKVTEEMNTLIHRPSIKDFLESELGSRMHTAAEQGNLFREKPFVMGLTEADAEEIEEAQILRGSDGMILIQGIIDVFWIEEDHIILLDYKTDRVNTAEELINMYRKQMDLYAKALKRIFHLPVKEKYLYSFRLHQTIPV